MFWHSLTYGTGANAAEATRRVPGEVTARALERLPEALDEHSPRLVLLCIGGNDFLRRLGRQQAEANVRAMVKLLKSRGVEVLLIGTPEPGFGVTAPAFYGAIAEEFGLPYEGKVIADVLTDQRLKSDPIHPNAAGYRVIAERVAERLKESGAI